MTVYFVNKNEKEQIHENNFETAYETDSHNLKHWQKQSHNVVEHECSTRVFNCESQKIDSQFSQKKCFNMNFQLNSFFANQKNIALLFVNHIMKKYTIHIDLL